MTIQSTPTLPIFEQNPLIPAVIQDHRTQVVLMLGYMNAEAYQLTQSTGFVTFYSRSREALWVKGESSGNKLEVKSIAMDCDEDTLLIMVHPQGPVCHTGADTCWQQQNKPRILNQLEQTISERKAIPLKDSYTSSLMAQGTKAVAQKVGEEAVELLLEATSGNDGLFLNEAADLLFHYLILLQSRNFTINDVEEVLRGRMK